MRLCDETVTVYNARVDPETRTATYVPTVLRGASWRCETAVATADGGLRAANRCVVRIPAEADVDGAFAEPAAYRALAAPEGRWTLQRGDVIVRGEVPAGTDPGRLKERLGAERVTTVVGVADNRRAPRGRHWKVLGE